MKEKRQRGNIIHFWFPDIPFSQVPDNIVNNPNVSAKAKGICWYMWTKRNLKNWWLYTIDITNHMKESKSAINSGLKELRKARYVALVRLYDIQKSQISKFMWLMFPKPYTEKDLKSVLGLLKEKHIKISICS